MAERSFCFTISLHLIVFQTSRKRGFASEAMRGKWVQYKKEIIMKNLPKIAIVGASGRMGQMLIQSVLASNKVNPDMNFFALVLSSNAALAKLVFVLPGQISVTFTLDPLSSTLKLCAIR